MFRLQSFVFPNLAIKASEALYVRATPGTIPMLADGKLRFTPGSGAHFDTFFNALTVGTWKTKCKIDELHFRLRGKGRFAVRFGLRRRGFSQRWLADSEASLVDGVDIRIELPFWAELEDGLLYVSVTAFEAGEICAAAFATDAAPLQDVKLGIVITHFSRKQRVLPAIARIRANLLADESYRGRIELVVVDNSRDIDPADAKGVTLIPNRNLGGSGGFTRGLMHLEDEGSFTHCLFMDDDASCEIESIRRAYALLSYARSNDMAVAGSLLRELEPNRTHEIGAIFDGAYRPLKGGLDACRVHDLLLMEKYDPRINYGGWWFFAFSLDYFSKYPFPFFVRGDDVLFSLVNRFDLVTMNGISCWGEDFWYKESPLTRYLWARCTLVMFISVLDKDVNYCSDQLYKWVRGILLSYHYDSAHAFCLALDHVCRGPQFFVDNVDLSPVINDINSFSIEERLEPIARDEHIAYAHRRTKRRRFRGLIRSLSLNGLLLPSFLIRNKTMFQPKGYGGNLAETYRYRRIHYEHEPLGIGFVLKFNRKRFFAEAWRFAKAAWRFRSEFTRIRKAYRDALPYLTSRAFWEEAYKQEREAEKRIEPAATRIRRRDATG
jgi:GT2 family glycosyltransferase